MFTFLKTLMLVMMLAFSNSSKAQQGPVSSKCTAFANSKVVAQYNCFAGMDVNNKVNFIQWEHGTASTGLGGWKRVGDKCFASNESPSWKICVN